MNIVYMFEKWNLSCMCTPYPENNKVTYYAASKFPNIGYIYARCTMGDFVQAKGLLGTHTYILLSIPTQMQQQNHCWLYYTMVHRISTWTAILIYYKVEIDKIWPKMSKIQEGEGAQV